MRWISGSVPERTCEAAPILLETWWGIVGSYCFRWPSDSRKGAPSFQPLLQPRTAVTIAARPWFFTVLVATVAAVVCVLHSLEIKVLFPIRALLQERRGTITDFDPTHRSGLDARIAHIAQILAPGHGALAKFFTLDGFKKTVCATGLNAGVNQVPHKNSRKSRTLPQGAITRSRPQMNISS